MSDRKYRQPGYQDRGDERKQAGKPGPGPRPKKDDLGGPRALQMPGTRAVSRCTQCGALLPVAGGAPEECPKCKHPLHSCKQCSYFDPGSRFECTQPIPQRVPQKDARNDCSFYSLRVMVEKETSAGGARSDDARRAFENLFKK